MRFEPNENLSITPRVIYQEVDTDGWNRQDAYNILGNPYTTTRPKVNLGDREQYTQIEEPFTDEFLLADLNIAYEMGASTLTWPLRKPCSSPIPPSPKPPSSARRTRRWERRSPPSSHCAQARPRRPTTSSPTAASGWPPSSIHAA